VWKELMSGCFFVSFCLIELLAIKITGFLRTTV